MSHGIGADEALPKLAFLGKRKDASMSQWTFTAEELGLVVGHLRIDPWLGSPLRRLVRASGQSDVEVAPLITDEMFDAIRRIARPTTVLGLVVYPPDEPTTVWFYGSDSDFALFHETADGYQVVWPVDELQLLDLSIEPLDLARPTSAFEHALVVDRPGLEALSALVDLAQENSLLGFLRRDDPPGLAFRTPDLLACWERGMARVDLKWMIHRASALSPIALAPSGEGLARGVQALASQQALVADNGRWRATPSFAMFCAMLGACTGFTAVSRRTRAREDGAWRLQHLAAARCTEGLWLFDFNGVTTSDFSLTIGDVAARALHERLRQAILAGDQDRKPDGPRRPKPGPAPVGGHRCAGCGATLKPDASFCSDCGAAVPRMAERRFCTSCGAAVERGKRFCAGCGAPVKGIADHGR